MTAILTKLVELEPEWPSTPRQIREADGGASNGQGRAAIALTSEKRISQNHEILRADFSIAHAPAVTYQSKCPEDGDTVFAGLIAKALHDLGLSKFLKDDAEGKPDALWYPQVCAILIKAIQDQDGRIDALEQRLEALETT